MSTTQKEINAILNNKKSVKSMPTSIEMVAIIKPSEIKDCIDIALGKYRWASIPIASIKSIVEVGEYMIMDCMYKVVEIEIARPEKDFLWYDILDFMIQQITVLWKQCHPETCTCEDKVVRVQKAKGANTRQSNDSQRTKPKRTIAHCIACWVITAGDSNFCGWLGSCD